jgi:RNA recognition motif-containing protein
MKIYAGMLLEEISVEDLTNLFKNYGYIRSVEIVREKINGGSFLYGLIDIPNKVEAWNAILALDGHELKSINLSVHPARVGLKDRRKEGRGGGRRRTDLPENK